MPRISNAPRARVFSGSASTPAKTPMKIPLNDDKQEKASRLQSRHAQHDQIFGQIKAAATPLRKRRSLLGASPRTPGEHDDENDLPSVSGTAVTPMKRVPIMADFEEWLKIATDNKINATNSWNFALIDYFHDMSLLKEGDGVNFQRASCTLDGCVKIYTNRVDSVATETGKLLSGLADSGNKKRKDEDGEEEGEDDGEGEEGEDGEDGAKRRSKKKSQRSSEATLASSFSQLQVKKMELEFSVDPLFKKASADFDEGGAKGLLLNHLAIDGEGRIVFDSSDDSQDATIEEGGESAASLESNMEPAAATEDTENKDVEMAVSSLAGRFFPDLSILDEQDICPSLKAFELGDASGSIDLPFLKAPDEWKQDGRNDGGQGGSPDQLLDDGHGAAFDDDDGLLGGLDLLDNVGFGEGGEAWAKEIALDPQMRVHNMTMSVGDGDGDDGTGEVGAFEPENGRYTVTIRLGKADEQENILNYFDKALQKNWAGPEHWKIRRVKEAAQAANAGPIKRKEKEPFEIDFAAPMSQALADALYTPASSSSSISLPRTQWKSKTRNLLPDDKHFSSRQFLRLFLKPKAVMGSRRSASAQSGRLHDVPEGEVDEAYWARKEEAAPGEEVPLGNYDADFFQDDGFGAGAAMGGDDDDGDDEFADARDHFSPPLAEENGIGSGSGDGAGLATQEGGAFGAQLVTQSRRLRPEYVQYARVAKKVDVRRLKEEIWRGMALDDEVGQLAAPEPIKKAPEEPLKFTDVINNLQTVYPTQAMADISTSYCFICLLHLANEKGLVIDNEENFQNLTIRKDHTAEIVSVGD